MASDNTFADTASDGWEDTDGAQWYPHEQTGLDVCDTALVDITPRRRLADITTQRMLVDLC